MKKRKMFSWDWQLSIESIEPIGRSRALWALSFELCAHLCNNHFSYSIVGIEYINETAQYQYWWVWLISCVRCRSDEMCSQTSAKQLLAHNSQQVSLSLLSVWVSPVVVVVCGDIGHQWWGWCVAQLLHSHCQLLASINRLNWMLDRDETSAIDHRPVSI